MATVTYGKEIRDMTQTLEYEYDELMARADELEAPILGQPAADPLPPCSLDFVLGTHQVVSSSGENLRLYLDAGQREMNALAQSLRNAAKAYEQTDENAAAAIESDGTSVADETTADVKPVTPQHIHTEQECQGTILVTNDLDYLDVKEAAIQIYDADQGVSMRNYADEWFAYADTLEAAYFRCRPFQYWEGDAREAVETYLNQLRDWMEQMVKECRELATKAQEFAAAQFYSVRGDPTSPDDYINLYGHPTYDYVVEVEMSYHNAKDNASRQEALLLLDRIQAYSEMVRSEYLAKLGFAASTPAMAPSPTAATAAANYGSYGLDAAAAAAAAAAGSSGTDPSSLTDALGSGVGMPSGGIPGGGRADDGQTDAEATPTGAATQPGSYPSKPAAGPKVKPASFGGGGLPTMPLLSAMEAGSVPGPAAAGDAAGPRRAYPIAGAAMGGGGGMGMAPPPAGANQGDSTKKSKRVGAEENQESLYVENRAWTETIIGKRRRQDVVEVEVAK